MEKNIIYLSIFWYFKHTISMFIKQPSRVVNLFITYF